MAWIFEPYTKKEISSFVGEMMMKNNQTKIAEEPIEDLKKKIRHLYDIHQLLLKKEFLDFFYSPQFEEMLLKVANDDVASYKNNNDWLKYHPSKAIIFDKSDKLWEKLKNTYENDFKYMV